MSTSESSSAPAPRVALVTGGSMGLGRALASALVSAGWRVITDARNGARLDAAVAATARPEAVTAIAGDVADAAHRDELASAVRRAGRLDVLVNNASVLGPSPQPNLVEYPVDELQRVYAVNVVAPLALFQLVAADLESSDGIVINLSSDAAAEAYQGWGGYGSSKAALDHATAILAVEHPRLRVYAFDPGDMNTAMHQQAFPGEDISDRAAPETVVPALLRLIRGTLPSARYRASELSDAAAVLSPAEGATPLARTPA